MKQLLPPLSHEEYQDLKTDIEKRGVQVPVVLNEYGQIIDGHHRVQICEELAITNYPRSVRTGLTPDDETELALVLNTHRRQLDRAQRRELVSKLRSQGWSERRIAESTGFSPATVHRDLTGASFEAPETVTGVDGKEYPTFRPTSTITLPSVPEFVPERESVQIPEPSQAERQQMRRDQDEHDRITRVRVASSQLASCVRIAVEGLNHPNSRANYISLFDNAEADSPFHVDRAAIKRAAENLRLLAEEWDGN